MNYAISPRLVMIYILFISVIADITYGVFTYVGLETIRISLLYRVVIIALFLVVILRRRDFEAWFIRAITVILLICFVFWISTLSSVNIGLNLIYILLTLFPMIVTMLIYHCLELGDAQGQDWSEFAFKCIINYGIVASVTLYFTLITGIGQQTYGDWAFGYKAFFTGGNDIGLTLLLSLCLAWRSFWINERLWDIFVVFFITGGILIIGSRASYGGAAAVSMFFSLALMFKQSNYLKIKFYKMAVVLGIGSISYFVVSLVIENIDDLAFQVQMVTELLEGTSPRESLARAGDEVIANRSLLYDIFGQGTNFWYHLHDVYFLGESAPIGPRGVPFKMVEADFNDLIGLYGFVFGSLVLLYHVCYAGLSFRLYFQTKNIPSIALVLAITMYIFHGLAAGHAMLSPQTATVIGGIYACIRFKLNQAREGRVSEAVATV